MIGCPNQNQLEQLLTESLSPTERSSVETHVERCARCQEMLEQLTADSLLRNVNRPSLRETAGQVSELPGPVTELQLRALLAALPPGQEPDSIGRLGGYEVKDVVGHGGMGVVFRAVDPVLRREVALKILAPHLAASREATERFYREARAAARVRDEFVVVTHAVGVDPIPHLVMEFVQGTSLETRLTQGPPLKIQEIVRIAKQAAQGLAAAHALGLVHRDIKPANILLEAGTCRVKLTDFGLAQSTEDVALSQSGLIAGTPLYMSPEQANGAPADHRADLFSLGSVLYVMSTGQSPFQAHYPMAVLKRVRECTYAPVRELAPSVPPWLEGIIVHLLAKKPSDRFGSAKELAEALERGENLVPKRARRRLWLGVGVLVLLVLGAGSAWWSLTGEPADDWAIPDVLFEIEFVQLEAGTMWHPTVKKPWSTSGYQMSKYEVTQGQWQMVMGSNPSHFSRTGEGSEFVKDISDEELERFPVESITGEEVTLFLRRLNRWQKSTGWTYRLPVMEEWDYACAGPRSKDDPVYEFYLAKPTDDLPADLANFRNLKALRRSCRVGSYPPNHMGLHDMHGNVAEWCVPKHRVHAGMAHFKTRGGSWNEAAEACRFRSHDHGSLTDRPAWVGLRLVRVAR